MRVHARRRARERYGLEFGPTTESEVLRVIQSSRSRLIERQSNRVSVHEVTLGDGLVVRVVYDRKRKQVVTFLPR